MSNSNSPLWTSLVAGGIAGTSVDVILFPLDTLKTRLQSIHGLKTTGLRGIYSGLSSVLIGSAPSAAMFFFSYEAMKRLLSSITPENPVFCYIVASSLSEIVACTVRVPVEVVKQNLQVMQYKNTFNAVKNIYLKEGILAFYRGFMPTIFREIPFACIQYPLYERIKSIEFKPTSQNPSLHSALSGSIAGAIAAALTTPLDVIKTRTMLSTASDSHKYSSIYTAFKHIIRNEGFGRLFSGIGPRVLWISFGGSIFFGVYERARNILYKEK